MLKVPRWTLRNEVSEHYTFLVEFLILPLLLCSFGIQHRNYLRRVVVHLSILYIIACKILSL